MELWITEVRCNGYVRWKKGDDGSGNNSGATNDDDNTDDARRLRLCWANNQQELFSQQRISTVEEGKMAAEWH